MSTDELPPLPEPVVLFWYRSDTNFSFRWVSPEGLFNEKEWHPLYGEESLALAARADLEAKVEKLTGRYDAALGLVNDIDGERNKLLEQLALRDADLAREADLAIVFQRELNQRDERIAYLERTHVEPEGWAAFEAALKIAQERAEAAEARVRELEQIHEEEWRNLKAERDALRAQIEAIRKQPTVVVFNGAGSWIVHSPIQIGKELIERPELP